MKALYIILTIIAIIGLITVLLGIFMFKENQLIFLGLLISGSATITNWLVNKKHLSKNKHVEK